MFKTRQFGFSLMEVILAIGILGVIGVITSNLLTRTYRTSSDTELIGKLKQNGSVASNAVSEAIRMADSVVCYGPLLTPPYKWIVIRTALGKYDLFRFVDPVPPSGPITQNGYIAKQENLPHNSLAAFCITNPPNFSTNVLLTDNNLNNGVSISNGEFTRILGIVGKDTVTIKFDVSPAGNQTGAVGLVNIQTTVQVR